MTKTSIVRRYPRSSNALTRDPFTTELDRLFNDFVGPRNLFARWGGEGLRDTWMPAVDIQETETEFKFIAELPGLNKDNVEITLENNLLTLSGGREFSDEEEQKNYHRIERAYGTFSRSFTLPSQVDSSKVDAHFADGLLTVTVPKSEESKPRKIKIS